MAMEFLECDAHVNLIVGANAETAVCKGCGITKEAAVKAGKAYPRLFDIQVRDKHLTLCHSCASAIWKLTSQAASGDIRYAVIREGYTPNYVVKMCSVVRESADGIVLEEIADTASACSTQYAFTREGANEYVYRTKEAAEGKAKFSSEHGY